MFGGARGGRPGAQSRTFDFETGGIGLVTNEGLFLGGIVVTLVPLVAGLYFGRYVLKANPLLLLGGLAGAQTFTPGLAAVQERSGSPIAVLGYSGSVAIAHVLLPMWGAVIVALVSGGGAPASG